jgi:hypothetical protein
MGSDRIVADVAIIYPPEQGHVSLF